MGEAKKKAELGVTRRVHVTLAEKWDLVSWFTAEQRGGRPGWVAADKSQRRLLRSALEQFGCYQLWRLKTGRALSGEKMDIPEVTIQEVSTDAITFVLGALVAATGTESLGLVELEERLERARDGEYAVPDDIRARVSRAEKKPAEEGAA